MQELKGAEIRLNASQARLMHTVEALAAQPIHGLPVTEVQARLGDSRDQIMRTLTTLEALGWAGQTPAGRWRLTPHLIQLSERLRQALADIHHHYLGETP